MPDNPSFTPAKHSSLRNAVAQMESLALSQAPTPTSNPLSSSHSSTPSLTGLNDALEEHALKQENGESLVQSPGARNREGSDASDGGDKGNTFYGATTPLLNELDRSTALSRKNSRAPTRAPSVTGIGNTVSKPDYSGAKIVVAMVGLPARGKSYLSNKLMRYLQWLEYNVKVFNVGQLRRRKAREMPSSGQTNHGEKYFDHSDADAKRVREKLAEESLDALIDWLKREGNVGIHDATNTTKARRATIAARVARERGIHLLFLESVCDDPSVIAANIALKVSSGDPDYKNMTREAAEADFKKRIENYEKVYEPVDEPHLSYCKVVNVGRTVHINRIGGYLESRVAYYLMNLHLKPRAIFLSRHGESMFNVGGQIGGDAELSSRGQQYSKMLPSLILDNVGDAPLQVWTSTLRRTIQTAQHLPYPKKTWKSLDELDAGVCDGMTYEEIEERYPEDYANRDEDKFNYRYRGGESYRDVVVRLEPVIMELERQENILIIGHQAIIRCLYAYYQGYPQDQLPYINIPLHTLIKLTPKAYGCDEERYSLPIAAVDTHRPKPASRKASPASTPKIPGHPGHGGPLLRPLTEGGAHGSTVTTVPSTPRSYFGDDVVPAPPPMHKRSQSPVNEHIAVQPPTPNKGHPTALPDPPAAAAPAPPANLHEPEDPKPRMMRSPTEY